MQMKSDYESNYSYKYMTKRGNWKNLVNAAQDLEDSKYVIISLLHSKIRVAFPDWYKLTPSVYNRREILSHIFDQLFDYDVVSIRWGKQAIWVEVA